MSELNFRHLRYFQMVAHEGHLTRAAARLNVSQSALSTQIRLLEDRLGQQLFERRGRSLHLTEAGRIALDHADGIFASGRDLVDTLRDFGNPRRPLRVGAIATLSRNFQMSFLRPVLGRNNIAITLRSGSAAELMAALTSLQIDLVLTNAAPETDALSPYIVQRIDEQPVSLIGVPAQCAGDLGVTELLGERPLILPTKTSGLRVTLDAVIDRLGVKPQIVAEVDDMAMVRLLAREGIGLAVIPPIVVLDELRSGQLVEAGRLTGLGETFYAITMERKFPNPVVRELLQTPLSVAEQPVN